MRSDGTALRHIGGPLVSIRTPSFRGSEKFDAAPDCDILLTVLGQSSHLEGINRGR
jgi:hypothetical protein